MALSNYHSLWFLFLRDKDPEPVAILMSDLGGFSAREARGQKGSSNVGQVVICVGWLMLVVSNISVIDTLQWYDMV